MARYVCPGDPGEMLMQCNSFEFVRVAFDVKIGDAVTAEFPRGDMKHTALAGEERWQPVDGDQSQHLDRVEFAGDASIEALDRIAAANVVIRMEISIDIGMQADIVRQHRAKGGGITRDTGVKEGAGQTVARFARGLPGPVRLGIRPGAAGQLTRSGGCAADGRGDLFKRLAKDIL